MTRKPRLLVASAVASASLAAAIWFARTPAVAAPTPAPAKVSFNRDVRPILSDNCLYCHGFDKNHREADLRLDVREDALKQKAFVPGDAGASELVKRIFTSDKDDLMPPPASHKKLTDAQKNILKQWIAEGAVYEPHWAYIAPKRWAVPPVKDAAWVRNPIDAFVLRVLESKSLAPSKEADRRTLLRRLSLDLIGLPPTPAEVQAFIDDKSPDAYAKQVERLLASPRYGERMAVPWLDAARYADTVGFHGDQNQNVFPYRDYVINAFNSNKPFDQFAIEQLAGDLLPNATTEQRVATGFNRLNMMTREGGAQAKEYLAKYAADRVRTVGNAFLGSTFGCAECHDHKFDPISTRDFYSMAAFFADVKQWGIYTTYDYTPNPDLAGFTNDSPFPPEIVVDSPYLKQREAMLVAKMDGIAGEAGKAIAADEKRRAEFESWRAEAARFVRANPTGWVTLTDVVNGAAGKPDDRCAFTLAGGTAPAAEARLDLKLPAGRVAAIRLEALPGKDGSITRDGETASVALAAVIQTPDGKTQTLGWHYADADRKTPKYANGYASLGIKNAWRTDADSTAPQTATYLLDPTADAGAGDVLIVRLDKNTLSSLRVSVSPIAPLTPTRPLLDDDLRIALADRSALKAGDRVSESDRPAVDPTRLTLDVAPADSRAWRAYLTSTAADPAVLKQLRAIQREVWECRDGRSPTLVTEAWKPAVTRVLPRGNWQDDSGEVVEPATPHFLPGPKPRPGKRLTRLDLAKWMISADNPLTSRVVVNRLWKQLFGAGLYNSIEDIGFQGEPPSHPELLDWLAVEFREPALPGAAHPWDVKHVVRLMVLSAAYRQDSNLRKDLLDADPANRLPTSQSPRRLEAEFVRDNALAAAGLLNVADVGGPSVMPYQPGGYYENIQFPNREWKNESDDRQYRRGVYTHWQRTFLHPMLANFDAPSREDSICVRNVSNTPQQALTLLNDPEYVEAARALAANAMAAGSAPGDDERLKFIFRRALARDPRGNERESLAKFLAAQRDYFKGAPADAAKLLKTGLAPVPAGVDANELAAWTGVARVVLNLHETITRY
jgi:hypothetical protein